MSMKHYFLVPITSLLLVANAQAKPEATLTFKMSPMGSFIATTSEVKGFAKMVGTKVIGEGISVPISGLDAGMPVRTKHMKEKYLEMEKYPEAKLIKAEGENGKGTGIIEVHGVQKPIQGEYKIEKDELVAEFTVKINEHGIAKVNYLKLGVKDEVKVMVRVPLKK